MHITTIKTEKITNNEKSIYDILDTYITDISDQSILAITSKIISICEGTIIKIEGTDKQILIEREADYYIPPQKDGYNMTLTIKNGILVPTAGIDESNGNGFYILWPKDPQKTANEIRAYLMKRFNLKDVGVIITDSKSTPLRRGTSGISIAHSGFAALNNYIGKPDIFGSHLHFTKANIMDSLAVASVLQMGEGDEQTPLALISDLPFVMFQDHDPSQEELQEIYIDMKEDLYQQLLTSVEWKKSEK